MVEPTSQRLRLKLPDGLTLVRALGNSPLSEVYLVCDDSGSYFALKVLRKSVARDPRIVERWKREAQVLVDLEHSNLVKCFGAIEVEGRPALLLEYVSGGSLRDLIDERPLSWEQACRFGIQISRALDYLHRNGAIHRDVKPHNILIHPIHGAVLSDLGLVMRAEDPTLTRHGAALGSPAYMSPEQALNPSDVGPQADIYSLGATLYHAISGQPPFVGKGVGEVIHRLMHEEPQSLDDDTPSRLAQIIEVAMAKDYEQRYDRGRSFGSDLGRVLLGYKPRFSTLSKWRRLKKTGAVFLALVCTSGVLFWIWPRMAPPQSTQKSAEVGANDKSLIAAESQASDPIRGDDSRPAETPVQHAFSDWIAGYSLRFQSYLQNQNLVAASNLLNLIADDFERDFKSKTKSELNAWLKASRIQVQALQERMTTIATNLLDQIIVEYEDDVELGEFDADSFVKHVERIWQAAGVDDHYGVGARLQTAVDKMVNESRQNSLNIAAVDAAVIDSQNLLRQAKFDKAKARMSQLSPNLLESNPRALAYMHQVKLMCETNDRLRLRLSKMAGQVVELRLLDGGGLSGELLHLNGEFFIDYRGQTTYHVDLLNISIESMTQLLDDLHNSSLAFVLWYQSKQQRAIEQMEQAPNEMSEFWLNEWKPMLPLQSTKRDPKPEPRQITSSTIDPQVVLQSLAKKFPDARWRLSDGVYQATWSSIIHATELNLDFAQLGVPLKLNSWKFVLYFPNEDSLP
ncbi:MAG: serine/threonine-protein kinase, partial [Planctomycetota bacterium]|nr:serine/threonine-protein kinase [Planctomycetota bacterium]